MSETTAGVSEERGTPVSIPGRAEVDIYMVRARRRRPTLFLPRRSLEMCGAGEGVKIRTFIRRLMRGRYPFVRWVGRVTRAGYRFYQRLEDRIDPLERMIKALNAPERFRVWHSATADAQAQFRYLLRRQLVKHTSWLIVDSAVTIVVVALAPFLVPIPGPNVFFYYPVLRLLSHYRARIGAQRALIGDCVSFEESHELARIEEDLRAGCGPNPGEPSSRASIDGLDEFLRRIG